MHSMHKVVLFCILMFRTCFLTFSSMDHVKYVVLSLLVFQTSMTVTILRYLRTSVTSEPRYLSSTMVFLVEVVKAFICSVIVFYQSRFDLQKFGHLLHSGLLSQPNETGKMLIPAALYAMQNNLMHIALSHLDAATFQVTYQIKILTTALFSVMLLKRSLSSQQWVSLVMLTIGVALVQLPDQSLTSSSSIPYTEQMRGLVVVSISALTSGLAGVYFELLLKTSALSLWIRNLQMAIFCMIFSAATALHYDGHAICENGFFQGYNYVVFFALLLQAAGGLLVACAVRYADNIIKGFATSLSVILSALISFFFIGDLSLRSSFVFGAGVVLFAGYLFGQKQHEKLS